MFKDIWDIGKDLIAAFRSLDSVKRQRILNYVRAHSTGLIILIVTPFLFYLGYDYLERRPERIIESYYNSVGKRDYESAWGLLSERYREKLGNIEQFKDNHAAVVTYTYLGIHPIGVQNGVAAIFNKVDVIEQHDDETTKPEQFCFLTRLQKEKLTSDFSGPYSLPFGEFYLQEDWRIVINNFRGICHYFAI